MEIKCGLDNETVTRATMKSCSVRDSFCVRFLAPKRADHETKRYRLFHLVVRGFVVQKVAAILVPHHRPVGCSKSCSWFILHREMREARETRCEMREARKYIRDKQNSNNTPKRQTSSRGTALSENAKVSGDFRAAFFSETFDKNEK